MPSLFESSEEETEPSNNNKKIRPLLAAEFFDAERKLAMGNANDGLKNDCEEAFDKAFKAFKPILMIQHRFSLTLELFPHFCVIRASHEPMPWICFG